MANGTMAILDGQKKIKKRKKKNTYMTLKVCIHS